MRAALASDQGTEGWRAGRALRLTDPTFGDAELERLAARGLLDTLDEIEVSGTRLTKRGFELCLRLPALQTLVWTDNDAAIDEAEIGSGGGVRRLDVRRARLPNASLLARLVDLRLDAPIGDPADRVAPPSLTRLSMASLRLSSRALARWVAASAEHIESLSLHGVEGVGDDDWLVDQPLPCLTTLSWTHARRVRLSHRWPPALRALDLSYLSTKAEPTWSLPPGIDAFGRAGADLPTRLLDAMEAHPTPWRGLRLSPPRMPRGRLAPLLEQASDDLQVVELDSTVGEAAGALDLPSGRWPRLEGLSVHWGQLDGAWLAELLASPTLTSMVVKAAFGSLPVRTPAPQLAVLHLDDRWAEVGSLDELVGAGSGESALRSLHLDGVATSLPGLVALVTRSPRLVDLSLANLRVEPEGLAAPAWRSFVSAAAPAVRRLRLAPRDPDEMGAIGPALDASPLPRAVELAVSGPLESSARVARLLDVRHTPALEAVALHLDPLVRDDVRGAVDWRRFERVSLHPTVAFDPPAEHVGAGTRPR
ncbi:MAG: hypothetical protein R3F65_14300 [bacterium]